ncbi:MAG TPA: type II secretion system F family protein [Xanthobacteraceae bacterium]|nr:type II secretion system F family protein [Xanthobacteraceae bacterium]
MSSIAFAFLITVAVGGVVYVFIYPMISGEKRVEERMRGISADEIQAKRGRKPTDSSSARRQQVEDTLKQLESKRKNVKNPPIEIRIQQAGLSISKRQFYIFSAAAGLIAAVLMVLFGMGPILALAAFPAGAFGIPRWVLGYLKKKRENKFILELPNAIDVIVRGVKAGLPIGDCIRIIANETTEPVKGEFRLIAEGQAVGMSLSDSAAKMFERVPLPEANFFGIVLAIQQQAGGNLSEALGNLSRVLRERKKMSAKIKAMSMEAKASASIIASLPFGVMFLVYLTSPGYIELLWTTSTGHMLLVASGLWMLIGVFVMRRMINFDF